MSEWRTRPCQATGSSRTGETAGLHPSQRQRRGASGSARRLFILLLYILLPGSMRAATENHILPGFTPNELGVSVTQWTVENGLPTQYVTALAQTPDAFIWCGTSRGLVRFDGVKFTIYDGTKVPVLEGVEITELAVDGAGRLWIVGRQDELVAMENGVFRRMGIADGLLEAVNNPRPDQQGDMWFKGSKAFYRYRKGTFDPVSFKSVNVSDVVDIHVGSNVTAWAVLDQGRKLAQIGLHRQPTIVTEFAGDRFGRFFEMHDGSLGLCSTRGVFKFHEAHWQPAHLGEAGRFQGIIHENGPACEDPSGNQWIGTYDQGMFVWLPGGRVGNLMIGSDSVTWIRAMICDAQGNVWVGKRDGLFRLRPAAFRNWAEESGMERSYVYSMAAGPDGTVWFANGWELTCLRPNSQRLELIPLPTSADKTWRVHVTKNGSVWAGDVAGQMFHLVAGTMQMAGSVSKEVTTIFDSSDGTLWVGSTEGLWRLAGNGFQKVNIQTGDSQVGVRSIIEESQGRLSVLTSGMGIFRREGESWESVPGVPKPIAEVIETLYAGRDGTLWATLATHGFARFREGQWSRFEISIPTGPAAFEDVAVDGDGYVWLPSNNGLFRVHQSLLTTNASQTITGFRQFDRNDGLGSVACTSIACVSSRAEKDRIWVGTQNGAAATDLKTLAERRERSEPPRTFIEAVQWDDQPPIPLLWDAKRLAVVEIGVPAGVLRLRVSYTATKVQFPEKATFQYRLLGLAEDWVQAGGERDANFLKLSPGRYQFQVRSANRHGDWNYAPAILGLRVLPAWWQMGWFRVGAGMAGAALLWLAYARRMRLLKREQAMQAEFSRQLIRSQEQERKRIAGELHDSLGQNLLVAKNLALMGVNTNAGNAETANQFSHISHAVSEALSEARRISRALRPPELDRMGLTKALRGIVQRAGEASGIECRITMEDIDGLLPAAEEINVYRLVQEGMNNIVKHSKAGHADVQLLHHPNHLELTIADDGQGFDVGKARDVDSPHIGTGLTSMEERTRLAGGEFEITSHLGSGTVVNIRIPVKAPKT